MLLATLYETAMDASPSAKDRPLLDLIELNSENIEARAVLKEDAQAGVSFQKC